MGVGVFSDFVFFLKVSSLPSKEKSKLKRSIISNGGTVTFVLNEKCTHAVVINTAKLNSTQQKKIQKYCILVVSPDFIWKLLQETPHTKVDWQETHKQSDVILDKVKHDKKSRFLSKIMDENKENKPERNIEDDEEFEDDENETNLPEDTEVAKYSFFEKDEEVAFVELLCFNESSSFRFKVCTTRGQPDTAQKEIAFNLVDTAEGACEKYELRINDLKNKGFVQVQKVPPQAEPFASGALQKVLIGEAISVTELTPEVAFFVESLWTEALGHLGSVLSCPVENISLNDVSKAEGILQQVRNALTKGDRQEDIAEMMLEFYRCIPHNEKMLTNIDKKFLMAKQDLCQLIRDMVNVCETSFPRRIISTTATARYQALGCRVEHVDPNTEEFRRVKQDILDNNRSNDTFKILSVFRIGRLNEAIHFKSDLGNVKSLLHASSPCNFVGILSRGLMLPKIIVEECGLQRTDIGNLGSGIYFSDSISTSVKYAKPSDMIGARLMVLSDVALGNIKPIYKRDYTITEPPHGFDSVHGVRLEDSIKSDFIDDEFVVYNANQVKMRYIVQFCNSNDNLRSPMESIITQPEDIQEDNGRTSEPSDDISLDDLPEEEIKKGGLQSIGGEQIPLESIHVKARLMDLAAQVVIFQTYKNESTFPIEAKYVFPLDSTAAVCGFEAFINGKHIIGEVKEKRQAHREYRAAISECHGAYLMDQDAPDVFTVSVGNLPPKSTVVIKISYVAELKWQYYINFSIPGTVASWQQDKALKENTQDDVAKVGIESGTAPEGSFRLDMSIEMPRKIESITCCTHKIKIKQTDCKAVVQTLEASTLKEEGFSLDLFLEESCLPRMWVETHPDEDSEACMLIFQPEFENTYQDVTITICLDCSNSMESCFRAAKLVALLALSTLYYSPINVILFGSTYKEFYFCPKRQSEDESEIQKFIKSAKPNMGSTEFWKPLQSLCLLRPSKQHQKVILISDGHLQNENLVFQLLKKNKEHISLFTCGVGATANKHMLRLLAQCSAGAYDFFADKSKSSWKDQMGKQENRLRSPACTAVSVKWRQFGRNPPKPLQAPANIQAVFDRDNLFVYGFIPHCTQATLKALIENKEIENMVSTTPQQKTTGTILHKLTARALIKDYEDGILAEKEYENEMEKQEMKSSIIALSIKHSIVTQFTSFVAIEKRSAEEDLNIEPNVLEIISAEDVDILPYMDWTAGDSKRTAGAATDRNLKEHSLHTESEGDDESEECFYEAVADMDTWLDKGPLELLGAPVEEPEDLNGFGLFDSAANITSQSDLFARIRTDSTSFSSQVFGSATANTHVPSFGASHSTSFASPVMRLQAAGVRRSDCSTAIPSYRGSLVLSGGPAEEQKGFGGSTLFGSLQTKSAAFPSPVFGVGAQSAPPASPLGSRVPHFIGSADPESHRGSLVLSGGPAEEPKGFGGSALFGSIQLQTHSAAFPSPVFGVGAQSAPPASPLGSRVPYFIGSAATESHPRTLDFLRGPGGAPKAFGSVGQSYSSADMLGKPNFNETLSTDVCASPPPPAPLINFAPPRTLARRPPSPPSTLAAPADFSHKRTIDRFRRHMEAPSEFGSSVLFGSAAKISAEPVQPLYYPCSPSYKPTCRLADDSPGVHPSLSLSSRRMVVRGEELQTQSMAFYSLENNICIQEKLDKPQDFQPSGFHQLRRKMKMTKKKAYRIPVAPSWSSLSSLQSQDGFWRLTPELGALLNINVGYLSDVFLIKKGICSLGSRGIDEIHKLIATLLVLQTIRRYNLLRDITFKSLMKLDQSSQTSLSYPTIKVAIEWAVKTDRQYPGICYRLGLGIDWDHATLQLLGMEPLSPSSELHPAVCH
ncbi:protein mono-ADP-ribosyltransferase PARP4 isoform X2 [Pseudophryne corroboree]|uniref:protein mono-ADP-ribosyltransferase PARP4 isoform X2 n=1 Tax=Pseudophryne corroboree TaxID=495146 RepID=UPI0030813011